MSTKPRVAERDHTLMFNPSDLGGAVAVSANALFVGPGEPGPGDEWQLSPESLDGASGETVATAEAAQPTEGKPHRRGLEGE
jgi:hypothetical protein